MAKLNIVDVIKCRNKITVKNLNVKNVANSLLNSLASAFGGILGTASSTLTSIIGKIASAPQAAEDALNSLESDLKQLYNKSNTTFTNIRNDITGMVDSTCTDAENVSASNQLANVVAEIISLPDSNDPNITTNSPIAAFNKAFKDAKSVAHSTPLLGMAKQIGNINNNLSNMGILETREYVRQFRNIHPLINGYINSLSNFQPISENIGASFLAYTVDKPSLQLEYWTTMPLLVRKNTKLKMRPEIANEIQTAYTGLNTNLVLNISTEFWTERGGKKIGRPETWADALHLKGDWYWYNRHILSEDTTMDSALIRKIKTQLFQIFGNQYIQLNYLTPIVENVYVLNDTYETIQEGKTIIVDKRNNIVHFPNTEINNNVLKPVESIEA